METTVFLQKPYLLESEIKLENFRRCFLASGCPCSENGKTANSWNISSTAWSALFVQQCDSQPSQPYCRLRCYVHPAHNFIWDSCPRSSNLVVFWTAIEIEINWSHCPHLEIKEWHKCCVIHCTGLLLWCVLHSHNNAISPFFLTSPSILSLLVCWFQWIKRKKKNIGLL